MKFIVFLSLFCISFASFAQDLSSQRIWKISSKKRSIFFDKGIFHSPLASTPSTLLKVRNSYVKSRGYERIVFDFEGTKPPKVYGHISSKTKKLYIDLFNTVKSTNYTRNSHVKYLSEVVFYSIDPERLSVELSFNSKVSFDVFYLENPGRIVIDVKK